MYTVKIPTDATGTQMSANLKLDVSSSLGSKSFTSAFTIAPIYSVTYAAGLAGNTQAHPMAALKISLKKGTKISLHNADTAVHITHGDGAFGNQHEDTTPGKGGLAGGSYVIDTSQVAVGASGRIGCHTHNDPTYATVTVVQ
jgi:hypothetical protein